MTNLRRNLSGVSETRRETSEVDIPRPVSTETLEVRVFSTRAQRNSGSLATTAATSELEKLRPARNARTATGLVADLRWESLAEALSAWALVGRRCRRGTALRRRRGLRRQCQD